MGRRGYRMVTSNYRCRMGEIDLIAREGGYLVFVEVRCKRTGGFGSPAESVDAVKQQKIAAAAQHYLDAQGIEDQACRFDVVEVVAEGRGLRVSDVIKDAFSL